MPDIAKNISPLILPVPPKDEKDNQRYSVELDRALRRMNNQLGRPITRLGNDGKPIT